VTNRNDISADLVVIECLSRGIDLYRLNSEEFPIRVGLSVNPLKPSTAALDDQGDAVQIGRAGIWIWRPEWPTIDERVTDELDAEFARQESVAALGGILRTLADRCVSPPDAMQAARWKLNQLVVAHHMGMNVPETLVTSNQGEAKRFADAGATVIKAVAETRVSLGAEERVGFVTAAEKDTNWADVLVTPVVLQRQIVKSCDLRVTVVGKRVFPVRITVPGGAPVDFRAVDPQQCVYTTVDLDSGFSDACLRFLDQFGLKFGAFDFAIDEMGRSWFLECNPAGQWGWLEELAGVPITATLVDLLISLR